MGLRLDEFRDEVRALLGAEFGDLIENTFIDLSVNAARRRLGGRYQLEADLVWTAGDTELDLPADYVRSAFLRHGSDVTMPQYREWNGKWIFDPDGVEDDGSCTLYYYGDYPEITETADSVMDAQEDDAAVSFTLYRFFTRLASDRAQYRRYQTITGQNGVTADDLREMARHHFDDFADALNADPLDPPVAYYDD